MGYLDDMAAERVAARTGGGGRSKGPTKDVPIPRTESEMYEWDADEARVAAQEAEKRGDTKAASYLRDRQARSEKAAATKGGRSKK